MQGPRSEENVMTDTNPSSNDPGRSTGDSGAWSTGEGSESGRGTAGREWVAQLQSMIDNLATNAAPVVREIGAKAAELAALAGEKAGPFAHRAADVTATAGTKVAERGREVAAELRRDAARNGDAETSGNGSSDSSYTGMRPGAGAQSTPGNTRPGGVGDSADSLGE
jgi:hypothetical protein